MPIQALRPSEPCPVGASLAGRPGASRAAGASRRPSLAPRARRAAADLAVDAQLGARVRINRHVPVGRRRRGADRLAHTESVQNAAALLHVGPYPAFRVLASASRS